MRISFFAVAVIVCIIGIVMVFAGLNLPWSATWTWPSGAFGWVTWDAGVLLQIGQLALVAWLAALPFQWLAIKRNHKYSLGTTSCGILIVLLSTFYILHPAHSSVEYGVYITLDGGLLTAAGSILEFLAR